MDNTPVMIFGIIFAFVLLAYMCMKGWSVFISAPICAIIVSITSGMNPLTSITDTFLSGTGKLSGPVVWAIYARRSIW